MDDDSVEVVTGTNGLQTQTDVVVLGVDLRFDDFRKYKTVVCKENERT